MMIAVIADIHGNYPALQAVLKEIAKMSCDRIISLGDVAGYYCMLNECIDALQEWNIVNVLGNHDYYLLTGTGCPRSKSANICLKYQDEILNKTNRCWLQQSLEMLNEHDMSFVHGGWFDFREEYITQIDDLYLQGFSQKLFFSGHTHIQGKIRIGEKLYCNPGSIGQPRDGDPRAAFAIISGLDVQLFRVEYDIDQMAFQMKQAGFSSYFYENLYKGTQIGGTISRANYRREKEQTL
jgi:putative phosphoesterase